MNNLDFSFAGIRAVDPDGDASDASSRVWNWACVHVCDAETAADDHLWLGKAADPDVFELAGSTNHQRAEDGGHRLRGDRAHV